MNPFFALLFLQIIEDKYLKLEPSKEPEKPTERPKVPFFGYQGCNDSQHFINASALKSEVEGLNIRIEALEKIIANHEKIHESFEKSLEGYKVMIDELVKQHLQLCIDLLKE